MTSSQLLTWIIGLIALAFTLLISKPILKSKGKYRGTTILMFKWAWFFVFIYAALVIGHYYKAM